MKQLIILIAFAVFVVGCSSKEVAENRHMMSDELQDIQKAKDAVKLVDSVNATIVQPPVQDSVE